MLYTLLYRSTAVHPFPHPSDLDILREAWESNRANGITGFLVRTRNHFVQFVEGPREAVHALQDRIIADPRHIGFEVLAEGPADLRQFPDWSMGYAEFEEDDVLKLAFLAAVGPATESRRAVPPLIACMKDIAARRGARSGRAKAIVVQG
ncbi:MAG: BLUF domain-containing protein [Maritimibacter sp.]|nr:BLUF domain-containing protein [Maritimibacter sp.]